MESLTPRNIIVRMPNWLGDLVMATPILKDLRNHWPEAKITAYCQGTLNTVIQGDPNINEALSFMRPRRLFGKDESKNIVLPLKDGKYDLGILLTNSFSSAWWFWRGNVKNRIGFSGNIRNLLLDTAVPFPKEKETQHLVKTYKSLLVPIGIPISNTNPYLVVSEQERHHAKAQLENWGMKNQIIIGINPGAAYGSAKCWLPERFQAVARKLLENPKISVLFFGDKAGAPLVNDICAQLSGNVINLAGKTTIRELMSYIQQCQLFLTNDSGPMHIASALGVPLLALFGSTSDVATGPYKEGTVIHKHAACSPCYRRECPIDFRCMKSIEVDEVYEQLKTLLIQNKLC